MAALPRHVVTALEHGPQADQILLDYDDVATLLDEGYHQTEERVRAASGGRNSGVGPHRRAGCHAGDVGLVVRLAWQ